MNALLQQPDRITLDEARDAILRSGYLLESRLEAILRNQGYYVDANQAYPDPTTGKSRELDVYGLRARNAGPNTSDWAFNVLLVECVNNPQPMAFITKDPMVPFLHHQDVLLSGLPVKILEPGEEDSWRMLPDYLGMDEYHHYCRGRVATQYCSFQRKRGDNTWMALHDEEHFESFRKLAHAGEYFADKHFKDWSFNVGEEEHVNIQSYYLLLVLQGELIDVRETSKGFELENVDHINFRMNLISGGRGSDYQVDVVTEPFFLST